MFIKEYFLLNNILLKSGVIISGQK